jgi:hypothetical protein
MTEGKENIQEGNTGAAGGKKESLIKIILQGLLIGVVVLASGIVIYGLVIYLPVAISLAGWE